MEVELVQTTLLKPSGTIPAKWIAKIGDTQMVHIRYWEMDPKTARWKTITTTANYCPIHHILYLPSDYPQGCPDCALSNGN